MVGQPPTSYATTLDLLNQTSWSDVVQVAQGSERWGERSREMVPGLSRAQPGSAIGIDLYDYPLVICYIAIEHGDL